MIENSLKSILEMTDRYEETYLDDGSALECIEHEQQKKVRYLQKYKKEWELDHKFRDWLEPIQNDPYSAYCNVCCSSLTARKKDLMDHGETRKHKKNLVYKRNNPALYHKMMQNIREVDANVIMDKSIPWQPDAIKCLIQQVEQQHDHFYDTNVKKSTIFTMICTEMNDAGFPCVPSECQRKWESLRKSYERVLQYQVKGEFKSRFPYFNMIHRFLAKDIDPLGMREKMLCQKLGRPYNPNDPLILDGNLDGTEYRTTIVSSKRDPPNVSINNNETTTEITISSCDVIDEHDDAEADHIVGIDADDMVHFEEMDTDNLLEEGEIVDTQATHPSESPVKIGHGEIMVREWEEGAVDALLAVMGEIEFSSDMMLAKGKFHDSFWEQVSESLLVRYCEVSALECRQKWRQLLAQYKRVFERHQRLGVRRTGVAAFKYYDCVGRILEKIHSVKMLDLPRQKRRLDDQMPEDPVKRRHVRAGRANGPSKSVLTPDRARAQLPSPTAGGARTRGNGLSRKRFAETLTIANVAEQIKKEREELPDADEEEPFMNETDGADEDEDGLVDDVAALQPKLKMKLMQTSLLRVTRRIEMLEREVARKNEDRHRDAKKDSHDSQIVGLLVSMLAEMKKMNSRKECECKCCCKRENSKEKPEDPSVCETSLPSIVNIVSDCATSPADSHSAAAERARAVRKSGLAPSSRLSSTKYQKSASESESDSLRKLVKSL